LNKATLRREYAIESLPNEMHLLREQVLIQPHEMANRKFTAADATKAVGRDEYPAASV
jgi:hypothetical protein